jgi:sterol 3beta-glucosyltransferase
MRITIFAAGSRGDIQPCLALASRLQQAGLQVLMAVPENFASFVQGFGLRLHPLRGDVQQIMASETGQRFMESGGGNPLRSIRAMRTMLGPVALQMAVDAFEASREAEALISLGVLAPFAQSIAEKLGISLINLEPTPLLPMGDFPAPGWPSQRNFGRLYNRLTGHAMLEVIWQWYRPFVNEFRRRLGLKPLRTGGFYRILSSTPLLGAYSAHVIPRPADWPAGAQITGYWFPEAESAWQPPPALEAFLADGDPPVYVGFGSMAGSNPEQTARLMLDALADSGQRGVLLTGWGGMRALSVTENVCVIASAPHAWLFPRMTAVVHHGGAGTTAEGLRAGVPAVIIPFIVDQRFWGARVVALGAGPAPIPHKKLTVKKLSGAIRAAVTDAKMKQSAARLGEAIRSEDGVGKAVSIVQQALGR